MEPGVEHPTRSPDEARGMRNSSSKHSWPSPNGNTTAIMSRLSTTSEVTGLRWAICQPMITRIEGAPQVVKVGIIPRAPVCRSAPEAARLQRLRKVAVPEAQAGLRARRDNVARGLTAAKRT